MLAASARADSAIIIVVCLPRDPCRGIGLWGAAERRRGVRGSMRAFGKTINNHGQTQMLTFKALREGCQMRTSTTIPFPNHLVSSVQMHLHSQTNAQSDRSRPNSPQPEPAATETIPVAVLESLVWQSPEGKGGKNIVLYFHLERH